jgi:hypothetical protein
MPGQRGVLPQGGERITDQPGLAVAGQPGCAGVVATGRANQAMRRPIRSLKLTAGGMIRTSFPRMTRTKARIAPETTYDLCSGQRQFTW